MAVRYGSPMIASLQSRFHVSYFPRLVVCDRAGNVVAGDAVSSLQSKPEEFPWPGAGPSPIAQYGGTLLYVRACILRDCSSLICLWGRVGLMLSCRSCVALFGVSVASLLTSCMLAFMSMFCMCYLRWCRSVAAIGIWIVLGVSFLLRMLKN